MNETMTIDEKALIEAKREAFIAGMRTSLKAARRGTIEQFPDLAGDEAVLATAARLAFPMPQQERPRVVQDLDYEPQWGKPREWRCVNGWLQSRSLGHRGSTGQEFAWSHESLAPITKARVLMLADLLANPTEECDAE